MAEETRTAGVKRSANILQESEQAKRTKFNSSNHVTEAAPTIVGKSTDTVAVVAETEQVALRKEIQRWLQRYSNLNVNTVRACIRDLAQMREGTQAVIWYHEVLCLRQVQEGIASITRHMEFNLTYELKIYLSSQLRVILHPFSTIEVSRFPNIRDVTEVIKEGAALKRPLLRNIKLLPTVLKKELKQVAEGTDSTRLQFQCILERLESTLKAQLFLSDNPYHYLMSLCVFILFGFNLTTFRFKHNLTRTDFQNAVKMLEACQEFLEEQKDEDGKQACVIKLALCSTQNKEFNVQYVMHKMSVRLCTSLKEVLVSVEAGKTRLNLKELCAMVDKLVLDKREQLCEGALLYSIKSQLHFFQIQRETTNFKVDTVTNELRKPVEEMLKDVGMIRYYPQKLGYDDVITLSSDVLQDSDQKPKTLAELPWFFMRHVVGLDSDVRENCHVKKDLNDSGFGISSDSDDDDDITQGIHPLDLIYIIFMCADDFLRQELADKMNKCQYAVPLILPSPEIKSDRSRAIALNWELQSITRDYYVNNEVCTETLVNMEAPVIVSFSLGKETTWKSKLLNKMLSPQQETFWHEGLQGVNKKMALSPGLVEVAWYLPGKDQVNTFARPATFLNVRQNSPFTDVMGNKLHTLSSVTCLFVTEITQELQTFLASAPDLQKVVILFVHKEEDKEAMKKESQDLQDRFHLNPNQIIRRTAEDRNFNSVLEQVKAFITSSVPEFGPPKSLSHLVTVLQNEDVVEVSKNRRYYGHVAARCILRDIDNAGSLANAKTEILPCQSDVEQREKMAHLDKELCRQNNMDRNDTIQSYAFRIKEEKWQIQLSQLQKPFSKTFTYFLQCISTLTGEDRKYFLHCLKLGLNVRSVQVLQPLHNAYNKGREEEDSAEKEKRQNDISERIEHGSFGLEHFFREMEVVYENMTALRQRSGNLRDLDEIRSTMSGCMAAMLTEGTAIEIMDGDARTVPVNWLKAVLSDVEKNTASTLFRISVVGVQSSGKSTLLNSMFGLNFPVSSGRCTRGAYLQLVKTDQSLRKSVPCDYVAVIDSEGLMAKFKDNWSFDNELSTLVIGLSDLTLVVIDGKGSEMSDVLPLAIHVFLRMKIVGEHQACHFVHQKTGAVDAMIKTIKESDDFRLELNRKTLAAAEDADVSDKYREFTDVLYYKPTKDNTFVPDLWTGNPPMAKANSQYSKVLMKLKAHILSGIHEVLAIKPMCTFPELGDRMDRLWFAIKYENFVLSFKSVLAVRAHKRLSKIYKDEQWALKKEMNDMIQEKKLEIENEISCEKSNKTIGDLVEDSKLKVQNLVSAKTIDINNKINHYFHCAGCDDCNREVTDRHLISNNEKEFQDEVRDLNRKLLKETETGMDRFLLKLETLKSINDLNVEINGILKKKVLEAYEQVNSTASQEEVKNIFEVLWQEATRGIQALNKNAVKEEKIEGMVQRTIREILGTDDYLYLRQQNTEGNTKKASNFVVDLQKHMKWKKILFFSKTYLNDQDVARLQIQSNSIIADTAHFYESPTPQSGKQVQQKDVEDLLLEVSHRLEKIVDARFKITADYKADLLAYIGAQAVAGFTKMHEAYRRYNSTEAILSRKKDKYYSLFSIQMGQADAGVEFCKKVLTEVVLLNIKERLNQTELLHDLRVNGGDFFKDIKSIQAAIMVDLFKENRFEKFLRYMVEYEACVKEKIEAESVEYFKRRNRLKELAKIEMDKLIKILASAMRTTLKSSCSGKDFIRTFVSQIYRLKIPVNEIAGYIELDIHDPAQFVDIVEQQLQGTVKELVMEEVKHWDEMEIVQEKDLTEFAFREIIGCSAICPFCKVPCDNHSGGITKGKHAATLHRPEGLGGHSWDTGTSSSGKKQNTLICFDCKASVASQEYFRSDETNDKWHLYKKYFEIYPNWIIHGNSEPDVEIYWKWVLAQHNKAFAKHYCKNEAIIPAEWKRYRIDDIRKDIEKHYYIDVDISQLK